jgi:hypothetical protein
VCKDSKAFACFGFNLDGGIISVIEKFELILLACDKEGLICSIMESGILGVIDELVECVCDTLIWFCYYFLATFDL